MILIVDDDPEIRRLLASYMKKAGYDVKEAGNAAEARDAVDNDFPELVLLDLGLPDQDGLSLAREWCGRKGLSPFPLIIISARVADSERILGLELGADDYIMKPFIPNEVVARVQSVLRRFHKANGGEAGTTRNDDILSWQDYTLELSCRRFSRASRDIPLTPTELSLLGILMRHPGWIFSREELLSKALGYDYEGMGRTLDTHIRNLRKKLSPDDVSDCPLETVYGIGYRWKNSK